MNSPITAVLNCYAPASGRNIGQVIIRADGEVKIMGDHEALCRGEIAKLVNSPLANKTTPPRIAPVPRVDPRRES